MSHIKVLILLLISTHGLCQLNIKSSQRFDFNRMGTAQKRTSGPELDLSHFSGKNILTLQGNASFILSLPASDVVLSMTNSGNILAVNGSEIKVYESNRGSVNTKYSRSFADRACFITFPSGALLTVGCDEEPGQKIEFYAKDLSVVSSFIPYASGYDAVLSSVGTADVLLYPIPSIPDASSAVFLMSQEGQLIFRKDIPSGERIGTVLCTDKLQAISSWSPDSGLRIAVFDRSGRLLWTKTIENEIKNWRFIGDAKPILIAATQKKIYILEALEGKSISEINLPDLYAGAKIALARKDNYFETLDIELIEGQSYFGLLVAEPWGQGDYLNVLLCTIAFQSPSPLQIIKIGNTPTTPLLRSSGNKVMLINGNEIRSYEH